jgi:hypothetical protein
LGESEVKWKDVHGQAIFAGISEVYNQNYECFSLELSIQQLNGTPGISIS